MPTPVVRGISEVGYRAGLRLHFTCVTGSDLRRNRDQLAVLCGRFCMSLDCNREGGADATPTHGPP